MPSITTTIKQTPSSTGYFLSKDLGGSFTAITHFILDPIQFTVGSHGVTAVNGTNIYFDTYANVVLFFTDPTSYGNESETLANNEYYRDMGKTYHIYVQQEKNTGGYYYNHVLTLSKAQRYEADGQTTEGVVGGSTSANLLYYFSGYLVTWSANPTTTGVPVGVSRVGFQ
jgi:hypothetical protein